MMSHSSSSMHKRKAVLVGQELRCKNGCGFFGNPEWQGYCSKCHKELNQKVKHTPETKSSSKKILRSYSDAHESPSFSKFEEKKKQQSDKRSKTIKNIIKRGHIPKDITHSITKEFFTMEEISQWSDEYSLKELATKDLWKQINTQIDAMIKYCNKSIDEQSEAMQEFYNYVTNHLETHHYYQELSLEQMDELLDKIEEALMEKMYNIAFNQISSEYEEKDLALQNRIRSLNWITPQRLGLEIKTNSPEIRDLIDKAITDVIQMNSTMPPQKKINCVVECCKNILNIINLCQGITVSADELLPALVYVVLKANPPLLHSNVKYITSYSIPARLRSGEGAYYFTNMCCAVEFIEHLTGESLNLTNEEFERYLAGEIPVDCAEQSVTSCEGIRVMSQNLIILSEIQERKSKMLNDALALKDEMSKFEETILKYKPTSTFKVNPTPYTIASHVDMSLMPEIFRSRVFVEDSNAILVDLDSKVENGENEIPPELGTASNFAESNTLADFQNMTLDSTPQPYTVSSTTDETAMHPLCVALPGTSQTSSIDSSLPMQNSHPILNIKDLEYPTEIFPDKNDEENPEDEKAPFSSIVDSSPSCLIDPLTSDTSLMGEMPPPLLNLPPPLQPVVVQSGTCETADKKS